MSNLNHFEEHPHALVLDNTVINIAAFAEHDEDLISLIAQANGGDRAVCMCNLGEHIGIGYTYDEESDTWVSPEPEVNNGL